MQRSEERFESWNIGSPIPPGICKGVKGKGLREGAFVSVGKEKGAVRRFVGTSEGVNVERWAPQFFVSVAFKGVSFEVSRLFATLAGRSISVASKGVMG